MHHLKRILVGLGLLVAVVLLGLVIATRLHVGPAPDPAGLIARANDYDARIIRDNFGVPHIFGKRDRDAAFGIAYAHAEDDFETIQGVTMAVRGRLAELQGAKAAPGDYLVNLMRVWDNVNARYDKDLPADVRAVLEAYADGVNLYAAQHLDRVAPGLLPVTGKDIAAGFVFKMPLFYGFDRTLKELIAPPKSRAPIGSNGLAVAPVRTPDGATRLLVNSHQPYSGPVAWYEAVIESEEGWHVAGGFFPGSPFMLHGHNEHLGWANTVNAPDLVDVYRLTINPDDADQYRLDGKWRDFEVSTAILWVKLFGPVALPVPKKVKWSAHGPVMETDHGVFALRYAGMNEIRQPLQYLRLDKARNLDEWKAAMKLQAIPSLNYIYADEKGHIGYVYNGLFPLRKPGADWQDILPGDRSDLIWTDYLPFDRIPQIWDPLSGLVFNSNNTPFHATATANNLKPAAFPDWMGIQSNMTNRAQRVEETYGVDMSISAADFETYKYDLAYSDRSRVRAVVKSLASLDVKGDAKLLAAQAILKGWNGQTDRANRGAALAILSAGAIVHAEDQHLDIPAPLDALHRAVATLDAHFGRLDPEWGAVNRIRRGHVNLPIDGGPDTFRAVYGDPQADGTLTASAGDTYVMFLSWDKDGILRSSSIHQFGSATLDAKSPHHADQTPLFAAMKVKPVLFTRAQLEGHVKADYRPGFRPASGHAKPLP